MEAVPRDVDTVVFPNYESMPERNDVEDPFTEVGRSVCSMSGLYGAPHDVLPHSTQQSTRAPRTAL